MNIPVVFIIKAFDQLGDTLAPIGIVHPWAASTLPDGWLVCNGQYLHVDDYPELFQAIGVTYSQPPFIHEYLPRGFFARLFRLPAKIRQVPNQHYRGPGMFAVPDLRNHRMLQRPVT